MTKITFLTFTLIACALQCRCEQLFVGIMETESYKDLELSISAFAGVSRIPELNQMLSERGKQFTALPEMKGFEPDKRIRIIQTVDPEEPLSEINPANIAIFTTRDGGKAIEDMLASTYRKQTYWRSHISIYDKPFSTNVVSEVAFMQDGQYILTSRNKNALLWISQNKKLLNAAPLKQSGALKLLLNPQRVAAVLNAKGDPRILKIFKPAEILPELESCTVSLTIAPQSLTITSQAKALAGSPLATLTKNLKNTSPKQPDITPPNSFLQSISYCEAPDIWNRFAINLQNYVVPALNNIDHKKLFAGKRTQYLAPAPEGKGLIFVQIDALKNKDDVTKVINSLESLMPTDSQIKLKKEPVEAGDKCTRYKLTLKESNLAEEKRSVYYTTASLFIQYAWLEMQVVDNNLISVIGPKNNIDAVVKSLNIEKKEMSLLNEISARNKDLNEGILCGTKIQISKAVRHTASIIPKITKEQLQILPEPGYGITFGLNKSEGTTLTASLQISTDEIVALSHIGNDARDLMQKLLTSMLIEQLEESKTIRETPIGNN